MIIIDKRLSITISRKLVFLIYNNSLSSSLNLFIISLLYWTQQNNLIILEIADRVIVHKNWRFYLEKCVFAMKDAKNDFELEKFRIEVLAVFERSWKNDKSSRAVAFENVELWVNKNLFICTFVCEFRKMFVLLGRVWSGGSSRTTVILFYYKNQ